MKKKYFKPELEATPFNTEWALCQTVPASEKSGTDPDPWGWAPGRKVF